VRPGGDELGHGRFAQRSDETAEPTGAAGQIREAVQDSLGVTGPLVDEALQIVTASLTDVCDRFFVSSDDPQSGIRNRREALQVAGETPDRRRILPVQLFEEWPIGRNRVRDLDPGTARTDGAETLALGDGDDPLAADRTESEGFVESIEGAPEHHDRTTAVAQLRDAARQTARGDAEAAPSRFGVDEADQSHRHGNARDVDVDARSERVGRKFSVAAGENLEGASAWIESEWILRLDSPAPAAAQSRIEPLEDAPALVRADEPNGDARTAGAGHPTARLGPGLGLGLGLGLIAESFHGKHESSKTCAGFAR